MSVARVALGATFIFTGVLHFARPRMYEAIMPDYLPAHRELVYASGVAEIAGGLGTLVPATRRVASWWSIATLVAVFPANVHMALHAEDYEKGIPGGEATLWGRLPVQALFIAWAYAAGEWDE